MQIQKGSPRSLFKRPLFWVAVVVVALIGVAAYVTLVVKKDNNAISPPNTVNYNPPTDEEKKATEAFKEQQQKDAQNPTTPAPAPAPGTKQSVTPIISYIGQYDAAIEASAYVSTIFEDGGTCTLTLKKDASTVTKTSQAVKDARSTRCSLIMFAAKDLAKGSWTATLTYESTTSYGVSKPSKLEVK